VKRLLAIMLAVVLALALAVPALANGATTEVNVAEGAGGKPVIKCKWETPDDCDIGDPDCPDCEPPHSIPGTQIMPVMPPTHGSKKAVQFWAVVTDPEGVGTVASVYVDVYHPDNYPCCGSWKYQLKLTKVDKESEGIPGFQSAEDQGLIKYAEGHNYASVLDQLEECLADVYKGEGYLDYHQPCGDYRADYKAYDNVGNPSDILDNKFKYCCVTAMEVDFNKIDYGSVQVCHNKWVGGDKDFDESYTSTTPTVRNLGNTDLRIGVEQDDMDLGQTYGVGWNVEYDARLGADGVHANYMPFEKVTLEDVLHLCNTEKLDFSIHIIKGDPGPYSGSITLTPEKAEFDAASRCPPVDE
jgi:hypothetical protein